MIHVSLKLTSILKTLITSLVIYGFFFVVSSYGQPNNTFFHELKVKGTPFNKRVNILYEDSYGFLWIGTNNGLYCYDGHTLKRFQYNVFDENSIPNNTINSIVEDDYRNLWLGTSSFLVFFDRKHEKFKSYYRDNHIQCFGKSQDSTIWAQISHKRLVKITPENDQGKATFKTDFTYLKPPFTDQNQIISFFEDNFGRKWIARPDGIFLFSDDHRLTPSLFQKDTQLLMRGDNNTLLAATAKEIYLLGYSKSSSRLEILESYQDFGNSNSTDVTITSMALDSNNTLWVGTDNGLYRGKRVNNRYEWEYFVGHKKMHGSLLNNQISSLLVDDFGNVWIGSWKGVNKLTGRNAFYQFLPLNKEKHNLSNSLVNSILMQEEADALWIGTNNGLYKYDIRNRRSYRLDPFDHYVSCIKYNYKKDGLFIAGGGNLHELKFSNISTPQERLLKPDRTGIMDVAQVSNNELWIGLWVGGLDIINTEIEISPFKKQVIEQLKECHTSVLLFDSNDVMWIGTRGKGLFKVDLINETFHMLEPSRQSGLYSNAILCLKEDKHKNIWIGTRGGGLSIFDFEHQKFTTFTEDDGLPSNTVSAIEITSNDQVWISTGNGLAVYNQKTKTFMVFNASDGITEAHFQFNASTSDAAGNHMFFGGTNGIHSVKNGLYKPKKRLPLTVISEFKLLAKTLPKGSNESEIKEKIVYIPPLAPANIVIPYSQNSISISFSSLDLTAPEKNEYAYRLKEINDYWTYTTAENRYANYNNLAPGSYTFEVKSSNSDGVWNNEPTQAAFTIAPPFWRTDRAYAIYAFIILVILAVTAFLIKRWYELKQNLLKETISHEKDTQHHQMKMVYFTDISHELRTPLTLVQGTIEKVIKEKNYKLSPLTAQRIFNNSKRMSRLIDQIMDIRKHDVGEFKLAVRKQNFVTSISKIKNAFNDLARIHIIDYTLKAHPEVIKAWFDFEVLEKILFNLLSNAFKYTAENGKIEVEIEEVTDQDISAKGYDLKKGRYVRCMVRDNGIGIPKEDLPYIFDRYYQSTKLPTHQVPGTGIGMELVHKLVELHYGTISVTSSENEFTEFVFYIPIDKEHYKKKERRSYQKNSKNDPILSGPFKAFENEPKVDPVKDERKRIGKILIVEDSDEVREMVSEELSGDYQVITATNGAEGFEVSSTERPDLIISDILMPVEDGVSMLKRLKQEQDLKHIPVFMLTARGSEDIKIQCTGLGADDFIEKPFSLEFLKWKVRNTLITRRELKEKYSRVITAEPTALDLESQDEKFIRKLIKIIEHSIDDHLLSVEYLASEVGMSRANLYRKVQQILNETPVNLIKQIRLKRAVQLMQDSNLYISEIAYMTGFKNQKYFSKCFHQHYAMSPSDFRKEVENNEKQRGKENSLSVLGEAMRQ